MKYTSYFRHRNLFSGADSSAQIRTKKEELQSDDEDEIPDMPRYRGQSFSIKASFGGPEQKKKVLMR